MFSQSYDALRSQIFTEPVCHVIGRGVPGDGGEGTFIRLDGSISPDDDGITLIDAGGNRWKRIWERSLSAAWFGMSPGNPNNRQALQNAIDAAWLAGHRRVHIPAGLFRLSGSVDASGVLVDGVGSLWGTHLVQMQPASEMFVLRGQRAGEKATGGGLKGLWLDAGAGVAAGIAVKMIGDTVHQPDETELSNLRISGESATQGGTWLNAIWQDATARTSPPGLRGSLLHEIDVFNCRAPYVVMWGANVVEAFGLECYTGLGTTSLAGIWIGGTPAVPSWGCRFDGCYTEGPINITNCHQSSFAGRFGGGRQIGGTTSYITVNNLLGT